MKEKAVNLEDLKDLLVKQEIPISKSHFGFLELINKQFHENINSAIYAHFLNSPNSDVRDLFLNALLELISEKSDKVLEIKEAFAQTEVPTLSGRLDILIHARVGVAKILIENKLNHWLHNDLEEYWNYFSFPVEKKVGIILTLEKHEVPTKVKNKFINLTHLEWVSKVKKEFIAEKLPVNYQIYIMDFIRTIENLSKSYTMNESVKFYFQHTPQILKASATISESHQFINNQLEYIANELGWKTYGNSMDWRNFWDEKNQLHTYFTIHTKDLLQGNMQITIILELIKKDKERVQDVRNFLEYIKHSQYNPHSGGFSKSFFLHFQVKKYDITMNDLENLGDFVVAKIRQDFADMTLRVIEFLYPDKLEHLTWRNQFLGSNQ
jgi:hypothetical protein